MKDAKQRQLPHEVQRLAVVQGHQAQGIIQRLVRATAVGAEPGATPVADAAQQGAPPDRLLAWLAQLAATVRTARRLAPAPATVQLVITLLQHHADELAATNAGGQVAPVGDAWELVLGTLPAMTLHSGDGSHPSIHGTYLAACVFYLRLTGAPLADTGAVPAAITSADASALRQAADQTLASP